MDREQHCLLMCATFLNDRGRPLPLSNDMEPRHDPRPYCNTTAVPLTVTISMLALAPTVS